MGGGRRGGFGRSSKCQSAARRLLSELESPSSKRIGFHSQLVEPLNGGLAGAAKVLSKFAIVLAIILYDLKTFSVCNTTLIRRSGVVRRNFAGMIELGYLIVPYSPVDG